MKNAQIISFFKENKKREKEKERIDSRSFFVLLLPYFDEFHVSLAFSTQRFHF
jgi:hypothetical protein